MLSKYVYVVAISVKFKCNLTSLFLGEKIISELGDSRKIEIYTYVR